MTELVISEPRRRTQIKRYGHDEAVVDMSDLETSSVDSDEDTAIGVGRGRGRRSKNKLKKTKNKYFLDDYVPRDGEVMYGCWSRSECFNVEKGLLTFGWGRWSEILATNEFRDGWKESDIEDCARVIMLYSLRFYKADEKIRQFAWELVTPEDVPPEFAGAPKDSINDNNPYCRSLKRNKKLKIKDGKGIDASPVEEVEHWSRSDKYDCDLFLDSSYRKHLSRHANKVLLRVRMLDYLKHGIIGDYAQQIAEGVAASTLPINPPHCDQAPTTWWDKDADRSLLVGTYKHGYEAYAQMRSDPALSFLARCGPNPPPILEEKEVGKLSDADEGGSEPPTLSEEFPSQPSTPMTVADETARAATPAATEEETNRAPWPSIGDLNNRLRRVITSYQRNFKKEELKLAQKAKQLSYVADLHAPTPSTTIGPASSHVSVGTSTATIPVDVASLINPHSGWDWQQLAMYFWKFERKEKIEQMYREKERQRVEITQRKWSKREEQEFYRTVSTYGVEFDRTRNRYEWSKFRSLSKLEKKYDETMTEYYRAFIALCKKVCGLKLTDDEESADFPVEMINEEKARRALERINLLNKIREVILPHPLLDERLKLCQLSADVPEWWIPGKHDKDLLIGVAKHGLGRTDFYILNDPELSFREIVNKNVMSVVTGAGFKTEIPPAVKIEKTEDIVRVDQNQIVVTLEKGEGTLQIEKIAAVKKEPTSEDIASSVPTTTAETSVIPIVVGSCDAATTVVKSEPLEASGPSDALVVSDKSNDAVKAEEQQISADEASTKNEEEQKSDIDSEKRTEKQNEEDNESTDKDTERITEHVPSPAAVAEEASAADKSISTSVDEPMDVDEPSTQLSPAAKESLVDDESTEKSPRTEDKTTAESAAATEERPSTPVEESSSSASTKNETTGTSASVDQPTSPAKSTNADESSVVVAKPDEPNKMDVDDEPVNVEPTTVSVESQAVKTEETETDDEKGENIAKTSIVEEKKPSEMVAKKEISSGATTVASANESVGKLKAMFPELEVMRRSIDGSETSSNFTPSAAAIAGAAITNRQPTATATQLERTFAQLIAQSYQNPIKWPKEHAIIVRLQHIVECVENGEWPVSRTFSAYGMPGINTTVTNSVSTTTTSTNMDAERDSGTPKRDTLTPCSLPDGSEMITITTDHAFSGGRVSSAAAAAVAVAASSSNLPANVFNTNPSLSITPTGPGGIKRKRHIAIDVETERAKLHALLNNNIQAAHSGKQTALPTWDPTEEEDTRRSTPIQTSHIQPPPAHQHSSSSIRSSQITPMPFDLKFHANVSKSSTSNTTPSASNIAPMDLSAGGSSKSNDSGRCVGIDLSSSSKSGGAGPANDSNSMMDEVQDFSMPSKTRHSNHFQQPAALSSSFQQSQGSSSKSKLDDMLTKLMQKKNCPVPVEEPVLGKEKKKRKLDEIVLGLREQQATPGSNASGNGSSGSAGVIETVPKKSPVSPSPNFVGGSASKNSSANAASQLLSRSLGAVAAAAASGKTSVDLSSYFGDQQFLLKQQQLFHQQQQQSQSHKVPLPPSSASSAVAAAAAAALSSATQRGKSSYEAMIADITKGNDIAAKMNSSAYSSHDAKVNKWLAEQHMPEQTLSADFLTAPRRRRPRVDPTLLDWKKLSGEENVSVINRETGKKLTGSKAPTLKKLASWLNDNPQYDVDPKWAELVKERGNLPHDLQKRLPSLDRKKGPGRPPILASPPTSQAASMSSASSSLPTSLASNLPFSSLASAAAGLGAMNPSSLLNSLSMGNFDPKNPLLFPLAAGVPNMGAALSGMGGLSNMNFLANLAGFSLPGLAGMDGSSLSVDHGGSGGGGNQSGSGGGGNSGGSGSGSGQQMKSSKNRNKPDSGGGGSGSGGSSKSPAVSTASSLSSSFPFFPLNPSLLYTPFGLSGLNPLTLQPGSLPPAYDSLALLNGSLGGITSSGSQTQTTSRHSKSSSSGRNSAMVTSTNATSSSPSTGRSSSSRSATPHSQFQMPEGHLMESLTKSRSSGGDGSSSSSKSNRNRDIDSIRNLMSNISPLGGFDPKKFKEHQEMFENLNSKFSPELFARLPSHGGSSSAAAVAAAAAAAAAEERAAKSHSLTSDLMEKLLKRSAPVEQNIPSSAERPSKRAKESSPVSVPLPIPSMSKLFGAPITTAANASSSSAATPLSASSLPTTAMTSVSNIGNFTVTAPSTGIDLSERKESSSMASDLVISATSSSPAATPAPMSLTTSTSKLCSSSKPERTKTPETSCTPPVLLPPPPTTPSPVTDERESAESLVIKPIVELTTTPVRPDDTAIVHVPKDDDHVDVAVADDPTEPIELKIDSAPAASESTSSTSPPHSPLSADKDDPSSLNKKRKPRNKKSIPSVLSTEDAVEKKNLRSSAGRAAAAAAARIARAAAAAQDEQTADCKKDDDSAAV